MFALKCDFIIFADLSDARFSPESSTNAQESLGRDFKRTAPKLPLSLTEVLDHSFRYLASIDEDTRKVLSGAQVRYRRRQKYVNDGRAPDVRSKLVRVKRDGRPKGAKSITPNICPFDVKTFGIPWSGVYEDLQMTNTCSLDTTLMLLYACRAFQLVISPELHNSSNFLCSVLDRIQAGAYNEARYIYVRECKQLECKIKESLSGQHVDMFGPLSTVQMSEGSGSLIGLMGPTKCTYEQHCSSPYCPAPRQTFVARLEETGIRFHMQITLKTD